MVHILGSILRQFLTTAQEPIPQEVTQKLQDIQHRGGNVGIEDLLAMLKIRLHQFQRAFICLDAADELEPQARQQLLKALKGLATHDTRLFLTGRDHIESEVQTHLQATQRYKAMISASEEDIKGFVEQKISEDLDPEAMDETLAKDIIDAIIEKSQGM